MFNIPVKEIIVNSDSQVVAQSQVTGRSPLIQAYADNDIVGSTNTGALILEGFLNEPIWCTSTAATTAGFRGGKGSYFNGATGAARMIRTAASAGVTAKVAYAITAASGAKAGDTYRVVTDSLDLTPTEYQNRPTEKRYQLSVDCANAGAIATELVARINADPKSQVIAYKGFNNASPAQDDSTKIVLVAKTAGVSVALYVGEFSVVGQTTYSVSLTKSANAATVYHTAEDTSVTTSDAALPVGTYDALKNINWAKNFSIDQNINWMPLPGASYNTYYFEVVSPAGTLYPGNDVNPNELHNNQVYGVRLYVRSGLTLDTALNLVDGDLAA